MVCFYCIASPLQQLLLQQRQKEQYSLWVTKREGQVVIGLTNSAPTGTPALFHSLLFFPSTHWTYSFHCSQGLQSTQPLVPGDVIYHMAISLVSLSMGESGAETGKAERCKKTKVGLLTVWEIGMIGGEVKGVGGTWIGGSCSWTFALLSETGKYLTWMVATVSK